MANRAQAERAQERELVIKAQKGDADAFAELVRAYWGKIYRDCYGFTWKKEEAEDLAQEACLKVWRKHSELKPELHFGAYLAKVTRNRCLDWLRQQTRDKGLAWNQMDSLDEVDGSGSPLIYEIVNPTTLDPERQAIFRDQVEKALQHLSSFERCVLSMRFVLGCSRADIAKTAGCTPQTIGNHEREAVGKFREYFCRE